MKRNATDIWFSRYIRLKYSDEKGYCHCFTCGKRYFWKDIQCGHYVKRQYKETRFNELNCRPQCVHCNYSLQGNDKVFRERLVKELGEDKVLLLESKKKQLCKFSESELKALAQHFKEKVHELLDEKGLKL